MQEFKETRLFAEQIRRECLGTMELIRTGHVGGSMSMAELFAALYGGIMNVRPEEPRWPDRDRLIVSKGHSGPALYAALALRGFFPLAMLKSLNQGGYRPAQPLRPQPHARRGYDDGLARPGHVYGAWRGLREQARQARLLYLYGAWRRRVRRGPDLGGRDVRRHEKA